MIALPGSILTDHDLCERIAKEIIARKMVRRVAYLRVADRGPDGPTRDDIWIYEVIPGELSIRWPADQLEVPLEYDLIWGDLELLDRGEQIAQVPFAAKWLKAFKREGAWVRIPYFVERPSR